MYIPPESLHDAVFCFFLLVVLSSEHIHFPLQTRLLACYGCLHQNKPPAVFILPGRRVSFFGTVDTTGNEYPFITRTNIHHDTGEKGGNGGWKTVIPTRYGVESNCSRARSKNSIKRALYCETMSHFRRCRLHRTCRTVLLLTVGYAHPQTPHFPPGSAGQQNLGIADE